MKKFIFATILLLYNVPLFSAGGSPNKEEEIIVNYYERNSLTIIRDGFKASWLDEWKDDAKYNFNNIKTKYTHEEIEFVKKGVPMTDWLTEKNIGREIISYIFSRNEQGEMNDSLILSQGVYSATAAQAKVAESTKLGSAIAMQDFGYELIDNNHILIISRPSANRYIGQIYRLILPDDFLGEEVLGKFWIYPEDDQQTRDEKNAIFNSIKYEYEFLAEYKVNSDYTEGGYIKIMRKIESKISSLAPQVPVYSENPITARIGKKESLSNRTRFDAYKYVERRGEVVPIKTATLKVCQTADNKDDNTAISTFFQIGGYDVHPGYILKQNRDCNLTMGVGYNVGSLAGYTFDADWLVRVKPKGGVRYLGISVSKGSYNMAQLATENSSYMAANPGLEYVNWDAMNFSAHYTYAYRPIKFLEAGLKVGCGMDMITAMSSGDPAEYGLSEDLRSGDAFSINTGAYLKFNIPYPLHLIVGVDCNYMDGANTDDPEDSFYTYHRINDVLKEFNAGRGGVAFHAGISVSF